MQICLESRFSEHVSKTVKPFGACVTRSIRRFLKTVLYATCHSDKMVPPEVRYHCHGNW